MLHETKKRDGRSKEEEGKKKCMCINTKTQNLASQRERKKASYIQAEKIRRLHDY